VPVIVGDVLSLAVRVCWPAVCRVKVTEPTPLVRGLSAGRMAWLSEEEKVTAPL